MNDLSGRASVAGVEQCLRERDWSDSPLGAPSGWPPALAHAARFMFDAATPMFLGWGEALGVLYNDASVPLLGGHHPATFGRGLRDWPEAWAELQPHVARARAGAAFRVELPAHALGEGPAAPPWLDLAFAPLRDLDGVVRGFSCLVAETTRLRAAEAEFRTITNAMPQMVWTTRPDGYHDYYNERWYDFTGSDVGATDGVGWSDMVHPDDRARTWETWQASLATGAPYEIEYRMRHRSGEYRWLLGRALPVRDAHGHIVRWMGTCTDIHQHKRNEDALRASETRFRRLAESNVVGMVRYRMDGAIIDANQAFLDMLGYSRAEFERGGLDSRTLTPPEWTDATARAMEQLRTTGRVENLVKEYFRKDGSRASVQMGSVTLDDPPTEGLAVMIDVTPIQEARHALREADRRKDEFLAMLAHELRNPLAPITAAADFLKVGHAHDPRIRQVQTIITRQARHMTGLIDDLLDVSRVTRGLITLERAPAALAGVIAEAVEQVRPQVKAKNHHLELHLPSDDAQVLGDRKRLVQVFANMLGNAARYTADGGRIDLHLRLECGRVVVDVCDNGIGMAPDLTARAFELFSQAERSADRSQGGLGIGLALVKSLVELHDGTVSAHSDGPGRGSRFTVALPRLRGEADDAGDEPVATGAAAAAEALDILIVDDNVDAAQILAMYIEAVGHRATVWHSPGKALAYAAAHRPDVCVLDIGLPEFDGHELARRLRAQPGMADVPLVAVSGYGQAHDRDRALAAGFDRHFVKPVMAADILAVLADVIGRRAGTSPGD
ncbi:PAS domain S-box protein [Massilia luteola]|uniref:PAS domain-containing hybrid sensor histidine kinase/response regulator n=1 Tax=Massilia luteola TaxID=3081751 RepID=UPI002ACC320A|nr:PAS domain S-box protein [Massilia sp. Gc5]